MSELLKVDNLVKYYVQKKVVKKDGKTMNKQIETLTEEAMQDNLTGFYNKMKGSELIEAKCRTEKGALMVIDLDNFKLVNDLHGHEMGDKVLCAWHFPKGLRVKKT